MARETLAFAISIATSDSSRPGTGLQEEHRTRSELLREALCGDTLRMFNGVSVAPALFDASTATGNEGARRIAWAARVRTRAARRASPGALPLNSQARQILPTK